MPLTTSFVFAFASIFGLTIELDSVVVDEIAHVASATAVDAGPARDLGDAPVIPELAPPTTARAVDVRAQLARRAKIGRIHRALGLTTFGAMTVTVVLGTLQYANLYGFFADVSHTRCVRGDAFFGQRSCSGEPLPHLVSALVTSVFYYTTFGLSYAMPDPIGLDHGNSKFARNLRRHKRLRWAHFAGMAAQMVLGVLSAHASDWLHIDRANDYRATRALATTHLAIGYSTYALLTWAGATMIR